MQAAVTLDRTQRNPREFVAPRTTCAEIDVWVGVDEAVISPSGDLDLSERDTLNDVLRDLSQRGMRRLVIDFGRTRFLALCVVHVLERAAQSVDGLVLVNAHGIVKQVLDAAGLGGQY